MYTQAEIDAAFKELELAVTQGKEKGTSCEDVLQYLYDNPQKIWHMSWELVQKTTSTGGYLSHRAPARASDLAIFDSHLVEDRKIGRFKAYRLRSENVYLIKARLGTKKEQPPERQKVKVQEKCEHGIPTFVLCPNCPQVCPQKV